MDWVNELVDNVEHDILNGKRVFAKCEGQNLEFQLQSFTAHGEGYFKIVASIMGAQLTSYVPVGKLQYVMMRD